MTSSDYGSKSSQPTPGCTIAAATGGSTASGKPIIMSTSDDPFQTRTRLVVEQPSDGLRFVATQIVSPPPMVSWTNMHTRGLNEAGLAYTWSYATPASEPTDTTAIGIPYYQVGSLLLGRATSVQEALDILDAWPRAFHGNYLFADRSGEIALAEVGTRTLRVSERTRSGTIGRTNHWLDGDSVEDVGIACSSHHRFDRIQSLLADHHGRLDRDRFMDFCRDHQGRDDPAIRHSICSHGHDGQGEEWFGTVSSEVIEPDSGIFWYAYGWPCGESPVDRECQPLQERSWGAYLPFTLSELNPGIYVDTGGALARSAFVYLSSQLGQGIKAFA